MKGVAGFCITLAVLAGLIVGGFALAQLLAGTYLPAFAAGLVGGTVAGLVMLLVLYLLVRYLRRHGK